MTSLKMYISIYICGKKKIYIYIYIHNYKSEVPKIYTIVNAIYIPKSYYFLCITLKLYKLRMTQNYIFEKEFVIWYMIGIDNDVLKKECFQMVS